MKEKERLRLPVPGLTASRDEVILKPRETALTHQRDVSPEKVTVTDLHRSFFVMFSGIACFAQGQSVRFS